MAIQKTGSNEEARKYLITRAHFRSRSYGSNRLTSNRSPFGGLALAGLMGTLRSRAEEAQAKVGQLVALKAERDALAA